MAVLALEGSTSQAKAMIYDRDVVCVVEQPYPPHRREVVELDPEAMMAALYAAGRQAVAQAGLPIEAIGLGSIWHSLLLLDEHWQPLGPISTWANTDSAPTVAFYRARDNLREALYRRTGCMIHSMYPLWQWRHLQEQGADLTRVRAISSQAQYMLACLTGAEAVSSSVASGSGWLNLQTQDWDEGLLQRSGLAISQMGRVCPLTQTFGLSSEAGRRLGLPSGTPVCCAGPDGALNQVGAAALLPGRRTFSVGTSGALRQTAARPLLPEQPSTWCYVIDPARYIVGAATSGAGSCIAWFREQVLGGCVGFDELETALQQANRDRAPLFLPFLFGERCPGWQDDRTGGYIGLTGDQGLPELYYALVEGILFNLYQCDRVLDTLTGAPDMTLLTGGITHSPAWMQLAADLFGRTLSVSDQPHASTLGAVAVARAAVGHSRGLDDVPMGPQTLVAPREAPGLQTRYQRYLAAYAAQKESL